MNSLPLFVALPGDSVYVRDGHHIQPGTVKYATVVRLDARRTVHRYTVIVGDQERIVSKSKILIAC